MQERRLRRFAVPEHHRQPLREFAALGDKVFETLRKSLLATPMTLERTKLAAEMSASTKHDVSGIIMMLCAVSAVWDDAMPRDQFIDDIVESMKEDDAEFTDMLAARLRPRLEAVLLIDAIGVAGKGASVASDHERLFCHARVVTDIRPVFRRDLGMPPAGAMLTHVLRISFHDKDITETNEFYVALSHGQSATFTVTVHPDTYYLGEMTGRPQFTPIRVAGTREVEAPASTATITETDAGYRITARTLPASGTVTIHNTGERPHRLNLIPVKPGTTRAQLGAYLRKTGAADNAPPPLFALHGAQLGTADISTHQQMQLTYELPVGEYALIDFDHDMTTGRPQALEGMYAITTLR